MIYNQNRRRSISGVGLSANLIPPLPKGSISDTNDDGSDLRQMADLYRSPMTGIVQHATISFDGVATFLVGSSKKTNTSILLNGIAKLNAAGSKITNTSILYKAIAQLNINTSKITNTKMSFDGIGYLFAQPVGGVTLSSTAFFNSSAKLTVNASKITNTSANYNSAAKLNVAPSKKTNTGVLFNSAAALTISPSKITNTGLNLKGNAYLNVSPIKIVSASISYNSSDILNVSPSKITNTSIAFDGVGYLNFSSPNSYRPRGGFNAYTFNRIPFNGVIVNGGESGITFSAGAKFNINAYVIKNTSVVFDTTAKLLVGGKYIAGGMLDLVGAAHTAFSPSKITNTSIKYNSQAILLPAPKGVIGKAIVFYTDTKYITLKYLATNYIYRQMNNTNYI